MKKFSKMLALGMAAALAFGMTVSAAGSTNTFDNPEDIVNAVLGDAPVQDRNGNVVDVKLEATAVPDEVYGDAFGNSYEEAVDRALNSEAVGGAVDSMLEAMLQAVPGTPRINHDIVEINVDGEIPEGGLYVPVLPYADGCNYVVAHWNGTEWEVLQVKAEGGYVYALFPQGFSPVYLSILSVVADEQPDPTSTPAPTGTPGPSPSSSPSEPQSPKTGETLPVAGILAVVCLAGVAVCARKAGCSR